MESIPYDNIWFWLSAIVLAGAALMSLFLTSAMFGRSPSGRRRARVIHSPNFKDGKFHNLQPTKVITAKGGILAAFYNSIRHSSPNLRPTGLVDGIKTDLKSLNISKNQIVWLGHSAYFMTLNNRTFLVDPSLESASPISFLNRPFETEADFTADDLPVIDYLVITHDHWDHLDYKTVIKLRHRIMYVICPLGVGEHFERWGFDEDQIIELDWWGEIQLKNDINVTCVPARHFSGRLFERNVTLWASFVIRTANLTIFMGGDGGYGKHFSEIAEKFPEIDFAIIENGQYNSDWCHIHTMPDELLKIANELSPKRIMTIHHSRYALARHDWHEPIENALRLSSEYEKGIVETPTIGQVIDLE